ncbi:hypothetical protein Tco_0353787, partial [Tanacetum coccineum]
LVCVLPVIRRPNYVSSVAGALDMSTSISSQVSSTLKPPEGLAVGADELSPTSYLGPRVIPNLFRGGKVTSGPSALQSIESRCKGGDEVGSGMGKSGGVRDGGASDLVWESMMGGGE